MSKIVKKLLSRPNAERRHPSVTCWGWVWTSLTGGVAVSALKIWSASCFSTASRTTLLISHMPILPKILFLQCSSKPEWKHAAADFPHRLRIHHPISTVGFFRAPLHGLRYILSYVVNQLLIAVPSGVCTRHVWPSVTAGWPWLGLPDLLYSIVVKINMRYSRRQTPWLVMGIVFYYFLVLFQVVVGLMMIRDRNFIHS